MVVAQAESIQGADGFDAAQAGEDSVDTSRVFYFKHQSGEIASGTVLDMDGCAFLGKAALKDRFLMAELYDMGQDILKEGKKEEETEELNAEEEPEEIKYKTDAKLNVRSENIKVKTTELIDIENAGSAEQVITKPAEPIPNSEATARKMHSLKEFTSGQSAQLEVAKADLSLTGSPATEAAVEPNEATRVRQVNEFVPFISYDETRNEATTFNLTKDRYQEPKVETKVSDIILLENTDPSVGTLKIEDELNSLPETYGLDITPIETKLDTEDGINELDFELLPGSGVIMEDPISKELALQEFFGESEDNASFWQEIETLTLPENVPETSFEESAISELSLPVKEVEETVILVAKKVEESDEEEAEEARHLLNQIADQVEKANQVAIGKTEDSDMSLETQKIEEKLKDLFIHLFDVLEVEYSPELVESFVKLVLKDNSIEFIPHMKAENRNGVKYTGTHEVIKQLLAGVSKIKKAILYAYDLGRSALYLYSQDIAITLKTLTPARPIQN